jgi:Kef-type K+ transport system membrane component KefB/Trk K+ transport system NAD-binding subunit
MNETLNYWPLFVVFVVAWGVPMILSWLEVTKVPTVIIEIVVGVIIGPFVLNLIGDESYLHFLSYTGFLFLIFLSGLEIDINKILTSFPKKIRRVDLISNSFIVATLIYFGSLILSYPISLVVNIFFDIDVIFFTLIFPTVALSIIVPILKNDGELARRYGQIVLMEAAIATIMSIILISIYSGILQNGFQTELLLFLVIFVAFFASYFIGKRLIKITMFRQMMYTLEHAASQIRIRGSVAVLLFFVVIAHVIKTELVLGAFFAGTLLSIFLSKERSALHFKLDGMSYGFFIPIFFIMVGVNLDLSSMSNLSKSIPFVALILISFYLIQILPSLILTKLFGIKKSASAGVLLTSRLGLTVATAQIGLSLNVIDEATNAGIVIASIFTSLISPLLYKYLHQDGKKKYKVYIIGGNKMVSILAGRMNLHGIDYIVITDNMHSFKLMESKGLEVIYAEFIGSKLYNELGIKPYQPVLILNNLDFNNTELVRIFKQNLKHDKIYVLSNAQLRKEKKSNEIHLLDKNESMAQYIENAVVRPDTFESLSENFGSYSIEEIKITNKKIDNKRVRQLVFHPSGVLVILRRKQEIFIPHGDTHLLLGDLVTVIGNDEALKDFRDKFAGLLTV